MQWQCLRYIILLSPIFNPHSWWDCGDQAIWWFSALMVRVRRLSHLIQQWAILPILILTHGESAETKPSHDSAMSNLTPFLDFGSPTISMETTPSDHSAIATTTCSGCAYYTLCYYHQFQSSLMVRVRRPSHLMIQQWAILWVLSAEVIETKKTKNPNWKRSHQGYTYKRKDGSGIYGRNLFEDQWNRIHPCFSIMTLNCLKFILKLELPGK